MVTIILVIDHVLGVVYVGFFVVVVVAITLAHVIVLFLRLEFHKYSE